MFEAKNAITILLQTTNRRHILQQLVEKQVSKMFMNFNRADPNSNPPASIKIPMNIPMFPETGGEKIQTRPEDMIKNDEGTDRIRLVRQSGTYNHNHNNVPSNASYTLPAFVKIIPDELPDQKSIGSFANTQKQ